MVKLYIFNTQSLLLIERNGAVRSFAVDNVKTKTLKKIICENVIKKLYTYSR